MLFNSWEFPIFFIIVLGLYYSLNLRWQNVLLLASSYVFYGWWDWRFLSLLWISTVVDYTAGRMIARGREKAAAAGGVALNDAEGMKDIRAGRFWLIVSLCTNLGILGFFKYFNFFVDSAVTMLTQLGFQAHEPTLSIVLPVGISFYTFQTMAYTIDVYRGRCAATHDIVVFGVYVAFFPQLVAGPIERAQHLIGQFSTKRVVNWEQFRSGALLALIGLVRKVAIADVVAGEVDVAFNTADSASGMILIRGVLLFALQIYGDFAGYSDMARGFSRMMGVELMENFRHPYFSRSVTEFWRRWHISLSTWLRDYLYIPLGGNRGSKWFLYRNLMLTMLLGGLWHGAAWTFVVWGLIHGAALVAHKAFSDWRASRNGGEPPRSSVIGSIGAWALTMTVVMVTWVFFRAVNFENAWDVFAGIFTMRGGFAIDKEMLVLPVGMLALILAIDLPQAFAKKHEAILGWPWWARGMAYAALILAVAILQTDDEVAFIYFQF